MSRFSKAEPRSRPGEDLYHKVGGEIVLKLDKSTVPGPITGIIWKHGKNKVAEWDEYFGLEIYAAFKGRTTLNQTTGELRISGLKKTDSEVYSVEFNSKLLDKTYKLSVIKAVPKPTITSSCNPDKTSCILSCEGNTTDAEPVTYSWKVGGRAWEVLDKAIIVSKSDTGKPNNGYMYICKLNNYVSGEGEVSEPVGEVFVSDVVRFLKSMHISLVLLVLRTKCDSSHHSTESLRMVFLIIMQQADQGSVISELIEVSVRMETRVTVPQKANPKTGKEDADKAEKGQRNGGVYET
ncbi:uncharacterized protein LOC123486989 [Coregonus clupeaformis]|uniref:uncharacterized protein LOC123486989 n=1 Tax=Coregonus clupeaformis TaxID=59861 RepID=UPI001E1C9AAA|nr:uncharacterized protein LOC123486989 [Coregonus clupeaformis]